MIKGMLKSFKNLQKGKELITLELIEAREIADMILKKIDKKIEILEAIESSVDEKILTLQRLIDRFEAIKDDSLPFDREKEVIKLYKKGLKIEEIAETLNIPLGEVELILNLQSNLS